MTKKIKLDEIEIKQNIGFSFHIGEAGDISCDFWGRNVKEIKELIELSKTIKREETK